MGKDSDIITLAFIVNSEAAGDDLVDWFERGYDWVLDASISEGELSPGKYLVFVEMERRSKTASRIVELLEDLETLTGLSLDDWSVEVDGETYGADKDKLKEVITISPHEYREEYEDEEEEDGSELNEMRQRAGIEPIKKFGEPDSELKAFKAMAGL
jgi:hypothetical protein